MDPVEISGEDYTVYADVDTADLYLAAAYHAGTIWSSLSTADKGRCLVTATRTIDRQSWAGTKSDPDQALAFPRDGMGISPEPEVDTSGMPVNVINASIELALALAGGSDVQNQQTTAERIKSLTAGSVSITNFRGVDTPTRFPQIVQELLLPFLSAGAASGNLFAKAEGVSDESIFPVDIGLINGL